MPVKTRKVFVVAIWLMMTMNPMHPSALAAQNKQMATNKDFIVRIIAPKSSVCVGSDMDIDVEVQNISKRVLPLNLHPDITYFEMIEPETEGGSIKPESPAGESLASEHRQFGKSYPFQSSSLSGFSYDNLDSISPRHHNIPAILKAGETHRYSLSLPLDVEFFKINQFYRLYVETSPPLQAETPSRKSSAPGPENLYRSNELIFRVQECKSNEKP